jgi:hypothetical protein
LAFADNTFVTHFGRPDYCHTGISHRPLYLRNILKAACVKILGISAFYHDSAAALIDDGAIGRLEKLSHLRLSSDSLGRVDDGGGDGGTARFL